MVGRHIRPVLIGLTLAALMLLCSTAYARPTEAQRLQEQIASLQEDVKRAGEAYSRAYWELEGTRGKIAKVDKQAAATERRLDEVGQRLGERIADMYRSDPLDHIAMLLTAQDFDEVLLRLEYLQRINGQDAAILEEARRLQEELAAQRAQLESLEHEQAEQTKVLKKEARRIEKKLEEQQAEYDKLQKELRAAVEQEKARTGRTSVKASPSGMVFPVRGPSYYNDTWGAARSGGRAHKGTDIMAPRGTPVVAVLSGTVQARENGLGGKTLWLTADNGWAFYYAHLDGYEVVSGRVTAGQTIGYVGSTGNASASAPHLHFEAHPGGGAAVNPYPYLKSMQ